ncbi:sulfotransferase domain-containing protein [Pseudomonadota bacterium]
MNNIVLRTKSSVKALLPRSLRIWMAERRRAEQERRSKELFENNLRKTDIFLVGHPKSGNTWMAYMLAILANNDYKKRVNISNVGEFIPTIHEADHRIAEYSNLSDPRIFRNEGPKYPELYPKTIYILRDPRSALLSYYHHCVHDTGRTDWKIADFVDEMITQGCIRTLEPFLIRWDRQVEAWLERAQSQPVTFVKYEDLMRDCYAVLERLNDFLGLECDENIITMAVERGGFSNMRKDEKKYGAESYPGEQGKKGFFVRKGKIDSWKEEMPDQVIEKIEKSFYPTMKKMGYLDKV